MRAHSHVTARVTLHKGVAIEFSRVLEASLDCHICQRSRRTIVLHADSSDSRCTPTGHPFPGKIDGVRTSMPRFQFLSTRGVAEVVYSVSYDFEPFTDTKYPSRQIGPEITWGRVSFTLTCTCGRSKEGSTQNNVVRPWTDVCACGKPLFFEVEQMPLFSLQEPQQEGGGVS